MNKEAKGFFVVLLVVSTLLGAVGQLLFKIGVLNQSVTVVAAYVVVGFVAYAVSSLIYLYVLGRMHLSWAYGFGGLSYIFATIFAIVLLGETVSWLRWAGVLIIAVGTALVGLS